jgi:hypothetical protein
MQAIWASIYKLAPSLRQKALRPLMPKGLEASF